MKTEFIMALNQLAAERNLPREVVLQELEAALLTAFKKDDSVAPHQLISVKVHPLTGEVKVLAQKIVVEEVSDPRQEISLGEAKKIKGDVKVGEAIDVEATPKNAGRIAAQTAKQVLVQRLRKTEQVSVLEEFQGKEGDIISGVVQRVEPKQVIVELGKTQGILPLSEQVKGERYKPGQRLRLYILEVESTPKGTEVILSRSHKNLLRRLLELEIPEIYNGKVEIKAIAREAGSRSKIAVAAREEGLDPVGSCVGLRGIRIQNIVKELNGEKIDIMPWDKDIAKFIANALSPAPTLKVEVFEEEKLAKVVVPDKQLSLAIGKEGQNARLAAKLTGWRIDIKSASAAEAEREVAVAEEEKELEMAELAPPEPEAAPVEVKEEEIKPVEELIFSIPMIQEKAPIRFAEDIFVSRKEEKKKKKLKEEEKPKKLRRQEIEEEWEGYV
jgi:N utilization substance protein A